MMSPSDPRFALKVFQVNFNHRQHHFSKTQLEEHIAQGTWFFYPMEPGDSRYMSECSDCVQAKASRNPMRHTSKTLGAADFFTKSLAPPQFTHFRDLIMNSSKHARLEWAKAGDAKRALQGGVKP